VKTNSGKQITSRFWTSGHWIASPPQARPDSKTHSNPTVVTQGNSNSSPQIRRLRHSPMARQ